MHRLRVVRDLDECRVLWERAVPRETVYDLWEVRVCFQEHFFRPPHFIVAEEDGEARGLLPLSWIEEEGTYGYFPGETWEGKTWLEQNRIPAATPEVRRDLLAACPEPCRLRYLLPEGDEDGLAVDEIGYSFHPPLYDYDFENYLEEFSGKSRRRLRRDLEAFEPLGVDYLYDRPGDFEEIVRLNVGAFGDRSFFSDPRFADSFRSLAHLLGERGRLRTTTVLIGGEVAAVDLGIVFNDSYTLLAGGTNGNYRGVAKLINVRHLRWACKQKFRLVDFLCGDFSWKILFHLTPRPLYLYTGPSGGAEREPVGAGTEGRGDAG